MPVTTSDRPAGSPVPIDPRIRQRRIEVKRDEGRRRLRFVVAGLAALACAGGAVAATHSALLDVDHVRVMGSTHTDPGTLVAAAGLRGHRFMIDVDAGAAARRIEALPWVAQAKVERRWPGTVTIVVAERRPVAEIPSAQKGFSLVDATGRVLATAPQAVPGLLVVTAADAVPPPGQVVSEATRAGVEVAAKLPNEVRSRIAGVFLVGGGQVELHLNGSSAPVVRLGSTDALDAKMVALSTLFAKANLAGAAVIDVRVPSAPVLTRVAPAK